MKRGTPDHPKTLALMRRLACSRFEAIGILETLWHWTARFAPRGDIGRWSDMEIEAGLGWSSAPGSPMLITALVECRWLDQDHTHRLIVHDWAQHADEATKKSLSRAGLQFVAPTADIVQTPSDPQADNGGQRLPAVAKPSLARALPSLAAPEPLPADTPPAGGNGAARSVAPAEVDAWWGSVWTAWCEKRGGEGRRADSVEFALARRWLDTGVPLRVVLRGIEDCSSKSLSPRKRLVYVGPAVDEEIARWRRSQTS